MFTPIAIAVVTTFAPTQTALLKFAKGETLKYKTTLTGSRSATFKGSTQAMTFTGGSTMVLSVTAASAASANMKVSYSGSNAKATVTALPPELRSKKAEFEKDAAEALRQSMLSGGRSQRVTSRGISTYTIPLGDGKSMTISDGAFMMLVLPGTAMASGKTWTANVRMPIPEATGSMKVTYKFVGVVPHAGQQTHKITFSSLDSKSNKQGDVSGKISSSLTGSILLGAASGKVLFGEVVREATTTLTHKTEGTRTAKQTSKQTFTKV